MPNSTLPHPAPFSWTPLAVGVSICALALLLTSAAIQWSQAVTHRAAQDRFEHRVALLNDDIQSRIDAVLYGLSASRALFAANANTVARDQFRLFVQGLDLPNQFPGVRGMGFIEHVPRAKLPQFIARERADQAPHFTVKTSGEAPDLYVIKYIEPLANNIPAWGYDIGSETVRRAAAQRAVSSGQPTLTARIVLVQDGRRGPGWLYLMPVYRSGLPTHTPEQRQAALLGLVYSPIVVAEVLQNTATEQHRDIDFELFDGPTLSANTLLFDADQHLDHIDRSYGPHDYRERLFTSGRTLNMGGRALTARYSSLPTFEASIDQRATTIIGVCGALLGVLIGFAAYLVLGARSRAMAAAQRMTADLERLAMVARNTSDAVLITDRQHHIVWVNEGFTRMSGYSLQEALNQHPEHLLHVEHNDPATLQALHSACQMGEPFRGELLRHNKSGQAYWLDLEVQPIRDAQGVVTGFMSIETDISERKRAESTLRSSEQFMRLIADNLPGHLAYWDRDLCCRFVNRPLAQHQGRDPAQGLGCSMQELLGDESVTATWHHIRGALRGQTQHFERTEHSSSGATRTIDMYYIPDIQSDGVRGFLSLSLDVTELKRAEHRLRDANVALLQARDHAERATAAKSEFLANMSHEIRTPMNAILGMLQLLMRTDLNGRQRDYAEKTQAAAHSLLALLNDILDFSKVEAGKMTLDPHPFRTDTLLGDLGVVLAASVGDKPVQVLFDIDPALPSMLVGDALRLRQIVLNLAGNAVKFTAQGHVLLRIAVVETNAQSVTLDVAVRDTGIGIAPENQQRIFAGFVQAEGSTTRKFGGTGLGLAISRHLVQMMGGELKLDSAEGQGSCFYFQLTLPQAATPDWAPPAPPRLMPPALQVRSALVVSTDAPVRDILCRLLTAQGIAPTAAADALEANAQLALAPFDCVLLQTPTEDAADQALTQCLIQLRRTRSQPIVIEVVPHSAALLRRHSDEPPPWRDALLAQPVLAQDVLDALREAAATAQHWDATPPTVLAQRLRGLRLLVVDDNLTNQQIARELLTEEGARVSTADHGAQAVACVRNADPQFHAVLMDLQMPVMDGYSATELIRREPHLRRLPIIAMTANALSSDREACFAAGMNAHVGKPFDLNELVQTLVRLTTPDSADLGTAHTPVSTPQPPATPTHSPPTHLWPQAALRYAHEHAVDLETALQRLGGKAPVYLRSLERFLNETRHLISTVQTLLQQRDLPQVMRHWHTLKGLAATLGFTQLAHAAATAEHAAQQACASSLGHQDHRAVTSHVAVQLATAHVHADALMTALASATEVSAPDAHPKAMDPEALRARLATLMALLTGADMRATDVFTSIQSEFGVALGPHMQALDQAIHALNFSAALQLCQQIDAQLAQSAGSTLSPLADA